MPTSHDTNAILKREEKRKTYQSNYYKEYRKRPGMKEKLSAYAKLYYNNKIKNDPEKMNKIRQYMKTYMAEYRKRKKQKAKQNDQ